VCVKNLDRGSFLCGVHTTLWTDPKCSLKHIQASTPTRKIVCFKKRPFSHYFTSNRPFWGTFLRSTKLVGPHKRLSLCGFSTHTIRFIFLQYTHKTFFIFLEDSSLQAKEFFFQRNF